MSKGAVVGKAHRLNLPPRISPLKADHVGVPRLPRPAPKPYAPSTNAALVAAHIPSIFRENAGRPTLRVQPCCWPLGEPRKPFFHFCGERSEPGKPYCDEHNGIGTVKRLPRHLSTRGLADKYGEPPASR